MDVGCSYSLVDVQRDICEIEEMITHFIGLSKIHPSEALYKEEIAYWRTKLQSAKRMKREVAAVS